MNVHEFQAKQLFAQFGVPVPRGKEITSPEAGSGLGGRTEYPGLCRQGADPCRRPRQSRRRQDYEGQGGGCRAWPRN